MTEILQPYVDERVIIPLAVLFTIYFAVRWVWGTYKSARSVLREEIREVMGEVIKLHEVNEEAKLETKLRPVHERLEQIRKDVDDLIRRVTKKRRR